MSSPRGAALLADALASSIDPRLLGAKTPPPRHQYLPPTSPNASAYADSSIDNSREELIIPLDSPSNIPHPSSAMRNPLDTWHTPVRAPHPVRRPSSTSIQQRPFFLNQSPRLPSSSSAAPSTTHSPQSISVSTMSPNLDPNIPASSSVTPAFFLECFGKDVTPGKRPAIIFTAQEHQGRLAPDNDRDNEDDSTSTADQTEYIHSSPAEEIAPRNWPSISGESARTASPEPFVMTSQLDRTLSLSDPGESGGNRLQKSPYDSPPPRLGGLFDGLPALSPSGSARLPAEFRFGSTSPPLPTATRKVSWLRTEADDAPSSADGKARSEADASNSRTLFPSQEGKDEYAHDDDDDDDDDRASIASSLLSLPVSIVTTASGGNNSRFLEEQRERERDRERERERFRFLSGTANTSASSSSSATNGVKRGLGLSLAGGAGGSAKETASAFLSALSKRNPASGSNTPARSPGRTPGTGSISFVTAPPVGAWNHEGTDGKGTGNGNGRRSRAASLLSAAGGFPLHLPGSGGGFLKDSSNNNSGGGGSANASTDKPSPSASGPGAVVASWKRRGLAALGSPQNSSALFERSGSMTTSATATPPFPSPAPTFSSLVQTPSGTGPGAGVGVGAGNPYFFPSAPVNSHGPNSLPGSGPTSGAQTPSHPPPPPPIHRPASILLKPSLGGAIGVGVGSVPSRPQSTKSTQSGASASSADASGSGTSSGGRRASEGAMAMGGGLVMTATSAAGFHPSLRMSGGGAIGDTGGRGKVLPGLGGVVPSPTSSSSGTPGGAAHVGAGGPIFTREVRIGGWTEIGHKASGWVEYDIRVQTLKGTTIRASRRFSNFVALRKQLAKQLPQHRASLPELPPRRHGLLHRYSPSHLEQRRLALQRWLHKILRDPRWGGLECSREFVLGGIGVGMGVGLGVGTMAAGVALAGLDVPPPVLGAGVGGVRGDGKSALLASGSGTASGTHSTRV
ncbi:unnamed protein product [Tilletia caries]|uniref:Endosomal/vacuolar adapter protein YPT35 n=2 Tax=Tilletia TaxID=13289 RepID=A0A8X7MT03_9BASI|nr:hypothetical protein CF336_g2032 [Tilletia laevis]KAE8197894.1 hypothetical protein CF328_g3710 [Tilletia controversa]KAE8262726.1 hypothetical protein A4X03_0g2226 [Tilletia caries]KAE8207123.1 hypothetical protein CF335_g1373 [Tilletia laevis]KAE8247523.1 hypothetical protein A4X06_0g4390 [Tilletia controversa]